MKKVSTLLGLVFLLTTVAATATPPPQANKKFPTLDEQLTLITCGGAFDRAAHMYVSRWVIRATPMQLSAGSDAGN